jgi:hypothetical protein
MSNLPHSLPQPELPHGFWCSPRRTASSPPYAITSLVTIQKDLDDLRALVERFGIEAASEGQAIQYDDPTKAR